MRASPRNRCDQGVRDCCTEKESHFYHVARTVSCARRWECPSGLSSALGCLCTTGMHSSAAETMKSMRHVPEVAVCSSTLFLRRVKLVLVCLGTLSVIILRGRRGGLEGVLLLRATVRDQHRCDLPLASAVTPSVASLWPVPLLWGIYPAAEHQRGRIG